MKKSVITFLMLKKLAIKAQLKIEENDLNFYFSALKKVDKMINRWFKVSTFDNCSLIKLLEKKQEFLTLSDLEESFKYCNVSPNSLRVIPVVLENNALLTKDNFIYYLKLKNRD